MGIGHRRAALLLPLLLTLALAARLIVAQDAAWECSGLEIASTSAATTPAVAEEVPFPAEGGELTVFAAASLSDAFDEIKADLEAAHPDLTIRYNFAGSQTLVTQLTEGARADVFASANLAQMDAAIVAGVIEGEPVVFVQNRLAIVVPADNPADIEQPESLANDGVRLVLAQPEVPVGQYSRQAICLMARDTARYGDEFRERVAANVVSEEDNVRDVLAKVQLGEADAGIDYVSDAAAAGDEVQLIGVPDEVNVLATYPIATVAGGDQELGAAFIAYVQGPEGQATLAAYGFQPIP